MKFLSHVEQDILFMKLISYFLTAMYISVSTTLGVTAWFNTETFFS